MQRRGETLHCIWPVMRNKLIVVAVIVLTAILTVLPQYLNHGVIVGVDAIFHFNRFYDVAAQITHHNYSYFQTNYGFQQTGRVVNALYGPYLAYVLGAILVHAGSWLHFELLVGILIEIIAGCGAYILARTAGSRERYALIAGLLFMLTGWVPAWLTTQEFMGFGAALMPYVLACGVSMLRHPDHHVPVLALALSAALLVQTHVLSSVIVALAMVPFVLITFLRSQRKMAFAGGIIMSLLLVILLTANVWGALLEVFGRNHVLAPYMPLNSGTYTSKLSLGNYGRGTLGGSLGIVCTVLFVGQMLALFLRRNRQLIDVVITATGAVFLILASALIPWNTIIAQHNLVGSYLQFPSRFTPVAALLLLTGLARTLSQATRADMTRQTLQLLNGALLFGVILVGYQTVADVGRAADQWNKPKVLQSLSSVTLQAPDMQTIKTAFAGSDLGLPLTMVTKATPDYLPVPAASKDWLVQNTQYALYHQQRVLVTTSETAVKGQVGNKIDAQAYSDQAKLIDEASPYVIYYQQIVAKTPKFQKTVVRGGRLKVTWTAKKRQVIQVPVVSYAQTELVLNGRKLKHSDYQRTDIGAVIVQGQKGVNNLTLRFIPAKSTQMILKLTPVLWLLFGILILFSLSRSFLKKQRH